MSMSVLYGILALALSMEMLTVYCIMVAAKRADENANRVLVPLRTNQYRVISSRALRN
jgi:hypothetical protein